MVNQAEAKMKIFLRKKNKTCRATYPVKSASSFYRMLESVDINRDSLIELVTGTGPYGYAKEILHQVSDLELKKLLVHSILSYGIKPRSTRSNIGFSGDEYIWN